jgi:hypothetical protein
MWIRSASARGPRSSVVETLCGASAAIAGRRASTAAMMSEEIGASGSDGASEDTRIGGGGGVTSGLGREIAETLGPRRYRKRRRVVARSITRGSGAMPGAP